MKIRIKFQKSGVMKFVGHLDMMRYFQKAMRRADIDIAYSTGFSPHQVMSFAAPLGVGITSDGEYLDIEVHSTQSSAQSIQALNDAMVDGVCVTAYRLLPDDAKTAMSIVSCADYTLSFREGYETGCRTENFQQKLIEFYQIPDTILVTKKTKKSEKVIDLKQLVYKFEISTDNDQKPQFHLLLSTGSNDNVKPEFVMEQFFAFLQLEWNPFLFQIHRNEVYSGDPVSGFVSLEDMGAIIEA